MTYAQKFEIIDVETNEVLNWKPLGREEKIGVSGAKALTGQPANVVHFREGTAIVWRDGQKWFAPRFPEIAWNRVPHGEFSEKMKNFVVKND